MKKGARDIQIWNLMLYFNTYVFSSSWSQHWASRGEEGVLKVGGERQYVANRLDPRKWSLAACGTVENLAKGAVRSGWTKQNESGTIMWRGSWPQIFWRPGENPTYLFSATTCGGRCRVYHPWPLETSDLCRVRASTRERWWVGLKSQPLVSEPAQPNNRRIWRNSRQRGPGEKNLGVGFDPGRSFHSGFPSLAIHWPRRRRSPAGRESRAGFHHSKAMQLK